MALSPTVARARFAKFVERALREARKRGLTDKDIERLTGIRSSTFHRWQTTEGGLPQVVKVNAFCDGLEIPRDAAYAALDINNVREATAPAPLDPDLSRVARILEDPNVPEEEKLAIRHTIRMLARAARAEREPAE
jgi:transcriptional regulator with XRE-family HTH domain